MPLHALGAALKEVGIAFPGKLSTVAVATPLFEIRGPKSPDLAIRFHSVIGQQSESAVRAEAAVDG
ncbi:MAG TPA: hypothetical protein VD995_33895 [Azospirillum sp.]|nr:hypothetical protein [Azospirillum sp.]